MRMSRLLTLTLVVDGVLALAFGAMSWIDPMGTFGTIVALAPDDAVAHAAFRSLPTFYVVLGALCGVAVTLPGPLASRFALVMLLRLGWVGTQGYLDRASTWTIGAPWPDIIIHTLFVLLYAVVLSWPRGADTTPAASDQRRASGSRGQ